MPKSECYPLSYIQIRAGAQNNMKKISKESEEDSDSFDIELWKATKRRVQEPQKRTVSLEDGKKTIKSRDDSTMDRLINSILRQSDKFPQEVCKSSSQDEPSIEQYEPDLVSGTVSNPHLSSNQEKKAYGLEDEGSCLQFDLLKQLRVVVVCKLGYMPAEGVPVQLYLPKEMASYLQAKEHKRKNMKVPKRMVLALGKTVVLMQRKQDGSQNMLDYAYFVIDPSNLVYPTYLCSWIDCKRRLALINYVQEGKAVNHFTVYGSTCHRLLEWFADEKISTAEYEDNPQKMGLRLYQSMLYDMFLIQKSFKEFWEVCKLRLENIAKFFKLHIEKGEQLLVESYKKLSLKVTKIVQSEIMIRSPAFGLKGKIDLLLKGELIDRMNNITKPVFIPMELKTGRKVSDSHKRQTDIYNILVRSHYNADTIGLLYYSDSDIRFFRYQNPLSTFEIVVVNRNRIAQSLLHLFDLEESPKLPSFPDTFSQCNYCQSFESCQLSYKQLENAGKTVDNVPSKYHEFIQEALSKFGELQKDYLTRWLRMLHLEQRQFIKNNHSLSEISIEKFSIQSEQLAVLGGSKEKERVRLVVSHQCRDPAELSQFDDFYKSSLKMRCLFPAISLVENCKVCDSDITTSSMTFSMTIEFNNTEVGFNRKRLDFLLSEGLKTKVIFETFQNSFFSSLRKTVFNLVKSDHFVKSLALQSPKSQALTASTVDSQLSDSSSNSNFTEGLNSDQTRAFHLATSSEKFCLVEGMPGTGKTQLIIRLVEYFCKQGQRILITTFTNRSLDNILQRLEQSERVPSKSLIREGSQYSAASNLKHFTSQSQTFSSLEDYQSYFGSKQAWFVTLASLSIHHLPQSYDVVILDQASQCLEPSCIEALLRGRKFIMIGDYLQLQPLVRSKGALSQGMGVSFFEKLCLSCPKNVASLSKQYRMHKDIMSISNALVYQGRLSAASKAVSTRGLRLGNNWEQQVPSSFEEVVNPSNIVVFINYDPIINSLTRKYAQKEQAVRKVIETQLPAYIANILQCLDVAPSSIAVIAALNITVNRISQLLVCQKYREGTVMTIDRSQGIDKEIIVLVIEKGNQKLVDNPRRLNVALTRAKSKLIVVGSASHLEHMEVWDGTLAKLFRPYQMELTKAMIEDMIKGVAQQSLTP